MGDNKVKSFAQDGCKSMYCNSCRGYLWYDLDLEATRLEIIICKCGTSNPIYPPFKGVVNGEKVIAFRDSVPGREIADCTFTADQTGY